jgi:hypothetical protein
VAISLSLPYYQTNFSAEREVQFYSAQNYTCDWIFPPEQYNGQAFDCIFWIISVCQKLENILMTPSGYIKVLTMVFVKMVWH